MDSLKGRRLDVGEGGGVADECCDGVTAGEGFVDNDLSCSAAATEDKNVHLELLFRVCLQLLERVSRDRWLMINVDSSIVCRLR